MLFRIFISKKKRKTNKEIKNQNYCKVGIINKGIAKTRLSKELGMPPKTIKKYIERLEKLGIVIKKKKSNLTFYFFQELWRNKLINYIVKIKD
ncbi:MAG: winged helix-turn-helix transcriptional regulator [Promethearchaeota archaeon]